MIFGCYMSAIRSRASRGDALGVYKKLISDALRSERFEYVADLVDVVKCECARLRIPYDRGQVTTAIGDMGTKIDRAIVRSKRS